MYEGNVPKLLMLLRMKNCLQNGLLRDGVDDMAKLNAWILLGNHGVGDMGRMHDWSVLESVLESMLDRVVICRAQTRSNGSGIVDAVNIREENRTAGVVVMGC